MYNQLQDQYAKQAGQAVSLQTNYANSVTSAPAMPMSAEAADIVGGLVELNARLRSLRTQLFGAEPENAAKRESGPTSLGQALCFAGMELREAMEQTQRILDRL
jgi:hypothetical protein